MEAEAVADVLVAAFALVLAAAPLSDAAAGVDWGGGAVLRVRRAPAKGMMEEEEEKEKEEKEEEGEEKSTRKARERDIAAITLFDASFFFV